MRQAFIYTLSNNEERFYVGSTKDLKSRLQTHKTNLTIGGEKIYRDEYKIEVLDTVLESERYYWERFYMEQMKQWGFDLFNKRPVSLNVTPPENSLTLPHNVQVVIRSLNKRGDTPKLMNLSGFSAIKIYKVINRGSGDIKLIKTVIEFYKQRSKRVQYAINKNNTT